MRDKEVGAETLSKCRLKVDKTVEGGGGLPQQRSGWASGLLSRGCRGTWAVRSLAGRDTRPGDCEGRVRVSNRGAGGEGLSDEVRSREESP